MSHKHAIVFGLVAGGIVGYFFADRLIAYQPWQFVASKV